MHLPLMVIHYHIHSWRQHFGTAREEQETPVWCLDVLLSLPPLAHNWRNLSITYRMVLHGSGSTLILSNCRVKSPKPAETASPGRERNLKGVGRPLSFCQPFLLRPRASMQLPIPEGHCWLFTLISLCNLHLLSPITPQKEQAFWFVTKILGCYVIQMLTNPWRLTLLTVSEYTTDCCLNNSRDFSSHKFTCLHRSVRSHHV